MQKKLQLPDCIQSGTLGNKEAVRNVPCSELVGSERNTGKLIHATAERLGGIVARSKFRFGVYSLAVSIGAFNALLAQAQSTQQSAVSTKPTGQERLAAADSSSAEEGSLGTMAEITVTAQKRTETLNRVGLTVSAIGGDELKAQGLSSVQDIARITPGLSYASSQTNTPVYTLRGVGFNDSSLASYPDVSVYVDEVPLPFPATTTEAGLDLERVEILKGPQGILFGTNATGGAINYIAAKPTQNLQVGADVSFSRFNTLETDGYISGGVTDTLSARLSTKVVSGGDWQRSDTRDDTLGQRRVFASRLLLDWAPASWAKLEFNLNGWINQSDPQSPQYYQLHPEQPAFLPPALAGAPFAHRNDRSTDWSPTFRPRGDSNLYQASIRGDFSVTDDITVTSITSYVGYTRDDQIGADGVDSNVTNYHAMGSIHSFFQELRAANAGSDRFRWVVGANVDNNHVVDNDSFNYEGASSFPALGIFQNYFSSDQKLTNYAGFGNLAFDLGSQFTLKGGVRYTKNNRKADMCNSDLGDGGTNSLFDFLSGLITGTPLVPPLKVGECFGLGADYIPTRVPFHGELGESNVSWQGGMDYKPNATTLLYVNVTKGYKAGSFPTLSASTTTEYQAVTQESVLDYEAGFKVQLFNKRLYLTGALFYYDYANKQVLGNLLDPVFGVEPVLINVPKSFVKGAETAIAWAPVQGLSTNFSLTYLDTRVTEYVGYNAVGETENLAGGSLPFAARWSGVFNAEYTHALRGNLDYFVGTTVTGQSRETTIIGPGAENYINEYYLLDLRAGIASRDGTWRASVWGKNITDKYYWNNVYREPDDTVRYAGMPATYGVTVSYRFK